MEVILLDSIPNLGDRGATVKVKPGYARNYLFPRNLALPATEGNRNVFKQHQHALDKRDQFEMEKARAEAGKLGDVSVTIAVQVGEEDKLYGSVSAIDIARKLSDDGHAVERRQIVLDEPIKQLGVYTVDVRLHREVSVPIKVWVVKE